MTTRFPKLLKRLDDVGALEGNWDGNHEASITSAALDSGRQTAAVLAMLAEVAPKLPAQIVPTSDGGLQFEWHEQGWAAEICIEPDGGLSVWCRNGDREFSYPEDDS